MNRESYFFKGVERFKKGDFDRALFFFDKNIKINPTHAQSYYYIGRINFYKKNYRFAREYFELCYSDEPKNLLYNLHLGKTFLALKEYEKSLKFLSFYAASNPDGYFFLGLAYYNLNDFYLACKYFEICEEIFIDKKLFRLSYSAALFNYGNQLYVKNLSSEAKKYFLKSINLNAKAYPAYFQLGIINLFENNLLESKNIFEYLNDLFPKNEVIKLSLSYIYNNLNEMEKFEKILTEIKEYGIIPELDEIKFKKILGYTLFRRKKYKEAIPLFIRLYESKNYDIDLLYALAICRYSLGDIKKAFNVYKIILNLTDTNVRINNSFLLLLIETGYFKEASSYALSFMKNYVCNDKTKLFYYYSSVCAKIKFDFNGYFEKMSPYFENNLMFLEGTALYFLNVEHYDKSIFYFHKLFSLVPEDKNVLWKLVEIFILKKNNNKALEYLNKIYLLDKNDEKTILFYSDFLIKLGFFCEALNILKTIKNEKWKAYYLLSETYCKMKDNKNYFLHLKEAFKANPLYLPIQYKSINYFFKNKNFLQSLRICKLMEYTNKEFKRVFIYEALIYVKKNRFDLAINRIEKYLFLNREKKNYYLKFILANCYFIYGKTEEAKKIILHLIKKNKNQSNYLITLCLCYKRNYEFEKLSRIENILENKFYDCPSYLEYKAYYLSDKKESYKRNDLGAKIIKI